MAKSSRSSRIKANRAAIRTKIFNPKNLERTERLNAKLMEIASQPKPERPETMDIDAAASEKKQKKTQLAAGEDAQVTPMDIDEPNAATGRAPRSKKSRSGRIQKKRRGKAASTITFPKYDSKRKDSKAPSRKR